MATDAELQVEKEAAEIAAAPQIPSAGLLGRCHFCGAVTRNLRFVEHFGGVIVDGAYVGGVDRYKGEDCCGG